MSFVHLHNHTHYSILSALAKPKEYIEMAKSMGMKAVAITDNGVLYGLIEFYEKAVASGIKPILGMEAYIAPLGRHIKTPENRFSSLVLLAKNNQGYQNLLKLASIGALDGFYYKPRIDDEILEKHAEGLIGLSAGLSGAIPKAILNNEMEEAETLIRRYQKIFGSEHFFLELQHHPEIANWSIVNKKLIELSEKTGAPLVAANDCHYAKPQDAEAHDVLVCVQTQKTVHDDHRIKYVGDYSLRSAEDMTEAFGFCPEALENTQKIADMCQVDLVFGDNKMPHFDTGKESSAEYLKHLCEKGLIERYGKKPSQEAKDRLSYELEVLGTMGFETYFLIVHDFIRYAKEQGIVVGPGRGSAAGSIIAYVLGITELDPLKYGLLFERFLNPERISMPDIDIDFADTRRDEVLAYVSEKYGADRVAQIITFGTLAPKAAIRDTGRAFGYSYAEVDAIAKSVPDAILGKYAPLTESIEEDPELSKLYQNDPRAKEVLDTAAKLEGTIRQVGTHACAVIISRDPLVEHTALQNASGDKEGIITQYSMKPCENLGLLKMDFLGLRNLSMMETTLGILARTKPEVKINMNELPMEDSKTYELLQRGETTGVFQLESAGMKRYLKDLKPTEFGDIIAMVSLYRPGPMQFISIYIGGKQGTRQVEYLHPSLEDVLKETYGIAIYQEQILEIAKRFAGFTLGEADLLRRAIGKKIAYELAAQREKFMEGAVALGQDRKLAEKIFDEVIEPFAGYGFNKSHAACYALIAYQTAYLKAHFPAEFMAALLTADADNTERVVIEIQECRNMGIEVLPPDINESRAHFTVVDDKTIRFGLTAVKGVGEGPVRELLAVRDKDGPFENLEDLAKRVPIKVLNKKFIESMALSGSLDSLGERAQIAANYQEISSYAKNLQSATNDSQTDIFGMMQESSLPPLHLNPIPPAEQSQRLTWEKLSMGLYISGHPLQGLRPYLQGKGRLIGSLSQKDVDKTVKISGLITKYRKVMTKSGKYMCFGEIDDPTAKLEFVLFPRTYDSYSELVGEDKIVSLEGKLDSKRDDPNFIVNKVIPLSLETMLKSAKQQDKFDPNERLINVAPLAFAEKKVVKAEIPEDLISMETELEPEIPEATVVVELPAGTGLPKLQELKTLFEAHPGKIPVELLLPSDGHVKRIKVPFPVDLHHPEIQKGLAQ